MASGAAAYLTKPFRPKLALSLSKSTVPGARYWAFFIAALLLAALLAGCGSVETGLQRDAARQLQARVLGVSEAAAANDPARALLD